MRSDSMRDEPLRERGPLRLSSSAMVAIGAWRPAARRHDSRRAGSGSNTFVLHRAKGSRIGSARFDAMVNAIPRPPVSARSSAASVY
jgi:hypothetical protein